MSDWADDRARAWIQAQACMPVQVIEPSLAALLREVYEQSHSETLVHCCIHRDEKAPYIEGCECVICHRQRTLAEVRRVVKEVEKDGGVYWACREILSRLDKL